METTSKLSLKLTIRRPSADAHQVVNLGQYPQALPESGNDYIQVEICP